MPSCSAARITRVPLGTVISNPSMVTVTPSAGRATSPPAAPRGCTVIADSIANRVEAAGSNGQPPIRWCSMYSSRKYLIDDATGAWIESPRAQNARPVMLSQMSSSLSRSASLPWPCSSRSSSCTTQ